MIKKVREELDLPIAIMLDTKGPEYRTGTFKNGKVHINDGDLFTFTTRDVEGSSTIVSVSYKNLAKELRAGDTILVNNGLVSFRVLSVPGYAEFRDNQAYPEEKNIPKFQRESLKYKGLSAKTSG